jgi:hypothetical protein
MKMQELAESEVTEVVVDRGLPTEEPLHKEDFNNPFLDERAIRGFMHRFGSHIGATNSPHRRGRDLCTATPKYMAIAKRRARNKVAKQSRKRNR